MSKWVFDTLFDVIFILILLLLVWITWHGFSIESGGILIKANGIGWFFIN